MSRTKPTSITPNAFNVPLSCQSISPSQLQSIVTVEKFTGDLYYLHSIPIDHVTFELVVELVDQPKKSCKDTHLLYTNPTTTTTSTTTTNTQQQPTLYTFRFRDWDNNELTLTMPLPPNEIPLHTFIRLRIRPYIPRSLLHDYLVSVHKYHTNEQLKALPFPLTHLTCSALKFFFVQWDSLPTILSSTVIPRLHCTLSNLYTSSRGMGIQIDVTNLSKVVWDFPDRLPMNSNPNQFAMINQYKDRLLNDVSYPCLYGELISREYIVHVRGRFLFHHHQKKSTMSLQDPVNPNNVFFFNHMETILHNRDRPTYHQQKGFVFSHFDGLLVDLTLKLHPTRYQQSIEILSMNEVSKEQLESTSQQFFQDLSTYQLHNYFNPKMSPAIIPYSHRQTVFDELEVPRTYYEKVAFQLDNSNYIRRHPLAQQEFLQQEEQRLQQQQQRPSIVEPQFDSVPITPATVTIDDVHSARQIHDPSSLLSATIPSPYSPHGIDESPPLVVATTGTGDDYQPQPKKVGRGVKAIKIISTSKSRSENTTTTIDQSTQPSSTETNNNNNNQNELPPANVPVSRQLPLPIDGKNPKPTFKFPRGDFDLWSQQLDLFERYYEKELDDLDGSYKDYIKTSTKPIQPDEIGDRQRFLDAQKQYEVEHEKVTRLQKELEDKVKELDESQNNYKSLQLSTKYQTLELTLKFEQSEKEKYQLQLSYQNLLNSIDPVNNNHHNNHNNRDFDYSDNNAANVKQQQRTKQIQLLRTQLQASKSNQQQSLQNNNTNNDNNDGSQLDDNGNGVKRKNLEPVEQVDNNNHVDQNLDYNEQYHYDDNFANKKQRSNLE